MKSLVLQEYWHALGRFRYLRRDVFGSFMNKATVTGLGMPIIGETWNPAFRHFWPQPIAHLPASFAFQYCLIFLVENSTRLETPSLIPLAQRELKEWHNLPPLEKRRTDWLLGRLAAKNAVRLYLKSKHGHDVRLADIEVGTNNYGRPEVVGEVRQHFDQCISISIAHSEGVALGIAGECGDLHHGVGVDVEKLRQNVEFLERSALTAGERALLSAVENSRRNEWLLRLWCAKEAAAKALGRGMAGGPLNLITQNLQVDTGKVDIVLAGELARQFPSYKERSITVYTGCKYDLVFATALA